MIQTTLQAAASRSDTSWASRWNTNRSSTSMPTMTTPSTTHRMRSGDKGTGPPGWISARWSPPAGVMPAGASGSIADRDDADALRGTPLRMSHTLASKSEFCQQVTYCRGRRRVGLAVIDPSGPVAVHSRRASSWAPATLSARHGAMSERRLRVGAADTPILLASFGLAVRRLPPGHHRHALPDGGSRRPVPGAPGPRLVASASGSC